MRVLLFGLLCFVAAWVMSGALEPLESPLSRLVGRSAVSGSLRLAGADVREQDAALSDTPWAPASPTPGDDSSDDGVGDDVQDELVEVVSIKTPRACVRSRVVTGVTTYLRRDFSLVGRSREGPEAPPPRA